MKLSNETLTILKNFSSINSGIVFRKGKHLKTVSQTKTILAEATLTEEMPQDFCIYDLNNFMLSLNNFENPTLIFNDVQVKIVSGKKSTNYRLTDKTMIVAPPDKHLTLPSNDVEFKFSEDNLNWILKSASLSSSTHISVESNPGEVLKIITFNADNDAATTNELELEEMSDKKFKMVFKTDDLKLIPGEYEVKISKKGISQFKNTKIDLQYWIAIEAKESKFEE